MPKGKKSASCAYCDVEQNNRICRYEDGKPGKNCPTLLYKETKEKSLKEYKKPKIRKFALNASLQEAECYQVDPQNPGVLAAKNPRIVEICEFAKKMGYKRLGLAFCGGATAEARVVAEILELNGFEVVSVMCKAGCEPKETLGMLDEQKIQPGKYESMCSPINQAMILNEEKTEFNIVVCLCVGHDSLFFQYSKAPVTVLAAKDRVTGHNPLAPIYTINSYYKRLLKKKYVR